MFPAELGLWHGDERANRMRFVAEQEFSGGVISLADLENRERRALFAELSETRGRVRTAHLSVDYREPVEAARERLLAQADVLLRARAEVPLACLVLVIANGGNRFDREFPLAPEIEVLSARLAPSAARCRADETVNLHRMQRVRALVRLCRRFGIRVGAQSPGRIPDWKKNSHGALRDTLASLRKIQSAASEERGVRLAPEPHPQTPFERPEDARRPLRAYPNHTYDYVPSHFIVQGFDWRETGICWTARATCTCGAARPDACKPRAPRRRRRCAGPCNG